VLFLFTEKEHSEVIPNGTTEQILIKSHCEKTKKKKKKEKREKKDKKRNKSLKKKSKHHSEFESITLH